MRNSLRILILLLVRIIGTPSVRTASKRASGQQVQSPRILLVRPDHLGDMVMTTPVLAALKAQIPTAHITMMVGPWASEIVARHPDVDQLQTCAFPGFRRSTQNPFEPYILMLNTARQLRRGNYDLALNLRPDFWWGAALLYLARIPHRIGYAIHPGTPFLSQALPFLSPEHATVSCLRLLSASLQALGYQPLPEPYTPAHYPQRFTPAEAEHDWVTQRLKQADIDPSAPFIVIQPGSGAAVKLWRSEAWAKTSEALLASLEEPRPRVLLTGSRGEQPLLEEVAQHLHIPAVLISDASVGQLAALLQRAQLVMGVDSGALHLAVAQQTPTLAIFGPTDPGIFGPWGEADRHVVIASTWRCPTCPAIPCGRLDFTPEELADHPCVKQVTEQQVTLAALNLLARSASTPATEPGSRPSLKEK